MPHASLVALISTPLWNIMTAYRVLARKYRPQNFTDLIGQDVLVRTLTNAFSSGRIAHAFLLTGIRGIGKTTTARIIARGLNCMGADGNGEPTTEPCGQCSNCNMILDDRHVDVIEMDAASRTGIDDIREIIDTVHYAPAAGRYKVYIIDEVHMLSKPAFNALLKTLEEPPPHVKFIFATTELRKIPVTIISRCQRFDLRRLDTEMLAEHLMHIATKESFVLDEPCATLLATAAEGSVRDSLSLLDQAIAMSSDADGAASIQFEALRHMLGLADKTQSFTLISHLISGQAESASLLLHRMVNNGVDPAMLLTDMLDIVHYLTRIKVVPSLEKTTQFSSAEQTLANNLCQSLDMPTLARAWQMLLKGVDELKSCANPLAALEMVLLRLCFTAQLPSPAEVIRKMGQSPSQNNATSAPRLSSVSADASSHSSSGATQAVGSDMPAPANYPSPNTTMSAHHIPAHSFTHSGNLALAVKQDIAISPESFAHAVPEIQTVPTSIHTLDEVKSFLDVIALMEKNREPVLTSHLTHDVSLVSFAQGHIEVYPVRHVPSDFAARVARRLHEWTGCKWTIRFADAMGEETLAEQREKKQKQALNYAASHPRVEEIIALFDGAEILAFEPNEPQK